MICAHCLLPGVSSLQQVQACQIWMLDLQAVGDDNMGILSTEEKARALRFAFQEHRDRYIRARLTLRHLLAETVGQAPQTLRIAEGLFGKPYLPDIPDCHFNLTHSASAALIGISLTTEVGLDLEKLVAVKDMQALSESSFTIKEQKALIGKIGKGMDNMFLRGWTRKEACLKAIGTGMHIAPNSFETGFMQDTLVHITAGTGNAQVGLQSLDVGPGWVAAFAHVHPGDTL